MILNRDFTEYLPAYLIIQIGQVMYDKANFSGLNEDQYKILAACKETYKKLRGEDIPLQYNCPA